MNYDSFYERVKNSPTDEWIYAHLDTLYGCTVSLNASSVIELGVQSGQSTSAFLRGVSKTGGKLWSCDINEPYGFAKEIDSDLWSFNLGNDISLYHTAPTSDIIFIDTSHEFNHTRKELELYNYRLNSGGIFILHDTYNLDCMGVFAAAVEFSIKEKLKFYNFQFCSGLGILGKDLSKVERFFKEGVLFDFS